MRKDGAAHRVSDRLRSAIVNAGGRGITRYRIAKETGIEQSALSRFVRGQAGLDLSSVDKLAEYLGLEFLERGDRNEKDGE